ncbi:Gfo/Idh/MocA family protein [Paraburkholderia sp. BCC1885]|uniref:Gfo/Idh/MocA family protein n=1 Tax=Paraburkholderia sp. BCC1885 TaxID=2562669 RepID=UPI0011829590|nr:Gfo/Idh/MocA family oxidoreductase [Paraburkholderia sp. BCC1885]
MSRRLIRFGLIGAGVAAETHARELRRVEGASLLSVYARRPRAAEEFARAFSIPRHYSDVSEFFAEPDIDAVIIASPNGTHMDYAVAAAQAGKHVVVEKPLEINEERAQSIVDACNNAGTGLFVIYQRRHAGAAHRAIDDLRAGKLGRVILANIVDNQFRPPHYYGDAAWRGTGKFEGGGCVITQSTHMIDLAQFILGPITSVSAHTRTAFHDIDTEDVAVAIFQFASGAFGTFSSSTAAYPGQRHLLSISGTEGSIIINGEYDQIVFRRSKHDDYRIDAPAGFSFGDTDNPREYPTDGQRLQLEKIVSALLGNEAPISDKAEMSSVRVVDAIYRSAASGRLIVL